MGLVIVYLLTSWLPTLMRDSGASMEEAAFIGALFQFGGVLSAVAVGWAMDRFNPHKVIGLFYLLAGVFAYAVGQSLGNMTLLATLVLVAGMCVNGAQSAMPRLKPQNMLVTNSDLSRSGVYSESKVVALGMPAPRPSPVRKRSTSSWSTLVA